MENVNEKAKNIYIRYMECTERGDRFSSNRDRTVSLALHMLSDFFFDLRYC